jgi:hypothetical protein
MNRIRVAVLCGLSLLVAGSRLLPHPPNFAPIAAVALFSGAVFAKRLPALLLALGSLLLSDLLFQVTYIMHLQPLKGFYRVQIFVYIATLAAVFIGRAIRNHRNLPTIVIASLASSVLFFLLTNLVLGIGGTSLYPITLQGQLMSYAAGLPFFRYTVMGDLFYCGCLFGSLALIEAIAPSLRETVVTEPQATDSLL